MGCNPVSYFLSGGRSSFFVVVTAALKIDWVAYVPSAVTNRELGAAALPPAWADGFSASVCSPAAFRISSSTIGISPNDWRIFDITERISSTEVAYSPKIQMAARWTLTDLQERQLDNGWQDGESRAYLIERKASNSFSIISGRSPSNFWIASRTKTNTSAAANSLVSERNSVRTGITVAEISGNLMQHEWRVRTKSCRYFPVSSCSVVLCVLVTS